MRDGQHNRINRYPQLSLQYALDQYMYIYYIYFCDSEQKLHFIEREKKITAENLRHLKGFDKLL